MEDFVVFLQLSFPFLLLLLGFAAGRIAETRHYRSIHAREDEFLEIPALTSKSLDDPRSVADAMLVTGSVVVSVDYFKRFLMFFRRIFGGEIRSYATLIDRGRREALLRMKASAPSADCFLNCRLETSTISNGKGKSVGTIEILAYATAIKFV